MRKRNLTSKMQLDTAKATSCILLFTLEELLTWLLGSCTGCAWCSAHHATWLLAHAFVVVKRCLSLAGWARNRIERLKAKIGKDQDYNHHNCNDGRSWYRLFHIAFPP
jgi:hypothetical protein